MKHITAMQELIKYLDERACNESSNGIQATLMYIRKEAVELLEKEKQQILFAYDAGKEQPSKSQLCPIDYYNQTYKKDTNG